MRLNAISLFSGAGGLDIGISKAGFDVKLAIEFDAKAAETLKQNSRDTIVLNKDIKDISGEEILNLTKLKREEIDLVIGGPPCQSFSSAGKMRSLNDDRGNMIFEYLRIIRELKPKTFLFENVKQFSYIQIDKSKPKSSPKERSKDSNLVINMLMEEFRKIGYNVNNDIINSADYGVPQKRERTIILGTLKNKKINLPKKTHSNSDTSLPNWKTLGNAIKSVNDNEECMVYMYKRKKYLKLIPPGGHWKNLSPELQKEAMGEKLKLGGGKTGFFRKLSYDKPSPTLCTSPKQPGTDMCHPEELRPLSVNEYAAIQEFPKNWKFSGTTIQKYKQIGNAVPVNLAFVVGKEIKSHLVNEI
ncbi:DNA (cytosine-5-)-methyltransferase [Candidatus Woesearchaeota archaeon CG10_big_fil_rev_8_21_14_0_10_32_24]|nr:MAG: DNA (cytosine-5-)-methyltransferase [Candidatus Woesearchaeota archaeon CG10_big_fil_rev_8_21_14_0_10_32_24]